MINHGTRGGYYAHRRLGHKNEEICDECRAAINKYVQEYRKKYGLSRNREREKIRRQALAALREAHREEYETLVEKYGTNSIHELL